MFPVEYLTLMSRKRGSDPPNLFVFKWRKMTSAKPLSTEKLAQIQKLCFLLGISLLDPWGLNASIKVAASKYMRLLFTSNLADLRREEKEI